MGEGGELVTCLWFVNSGRYERSPRRFPAVNTVTKDRVEGLGPRWESEFVRYCATEAGSVVDFDVLWVGLKLRHDAGPARAGCGDDEEHSHSASKEDIFFRTPATRV